MTNSILIEEDCTVLLERALLRKTVVAFGDDGCGLHGRSSIPRYFDIVDIRIDIEDGKVPTLSVCLRNYNHNDVGHIMTDKNFEISFNSILKASNISKDAFSWASLQEQVDGCVTFNLDIPELLGW